ncbi:MAG: trypsin-like peptidase domain-containing protein [Pseudomonadota bacterium]
MRFWLSLTLSLVAATASAQAPEVTPRGPLWDEERATIELFEAARDSVVSITTEAQVVDAFGLRRFREEAGGGSGFIWDDRGHVVTNDHVIAQASGATVLLADGRSLRARLVGRAPDHDLAVLRIDPAGLPASLPLGTSNDLRVGQKVFAIGNPFGLDWTLTTGIVSALDRELPVGPRLTIRGVIQTDAAINPGNSGGPLLDSAGRLIGVNTAIYSPSGASAGIGFAVPASTVRRVVPQLIERGRYAPPTIGIRYDPMLNSAAARQGVVGVVILAVDPGSPAAAAGLQPATRGLGGGVVPGDVIVGADGTLVETGDDLAAVLDTRAPGETVTLSILRDGQVRDVAVRLAPGG